MENNLKFNSAICTSRFQSEGLLALGLRKETADMFIGIDWGKELAYDKNGGYTSNLDASIPAWSLGRLIEMMPRTAIIHTQEGDARIDIDIYAIEILVSENPIAEAVSVIEWLIKEGNFNKKYLV